MSNIVQRNLQRSLAKSVSVLAEETGFSPSEIINTLNDEYGYVTPELLPDLNKQVELDRAADLHAKQKKIKVNKVAVLKTALDRETSELAKIVRNKGEDSRFQV
ncbi:hypothetical protein [Psychrobacter sp. CAL346-MNA-CIBAN-0220]|uniref:hypothetical protein n=1 Tax=Psychrobacter sp. CAL346-MNA-CIBAN-0220 TaxID=3140457 RepID=UPI0033280CC8